MARQHLHGFGAFFFVTGMCLLLIAVIVGLTADEKLQVLVAGAMIAFAVAGAICFVAAAITLLPAAQPHSEANPPRPPQKSANEKEWPATPRDAEQDRFSDKPGANR